MNIKLELVHDFKHCWKWLSVQGMSMALAIQGTWITMPDDWRSKFPEKWIIGATMFCLVFGIIGRIIQKPEPKNRRVEDETDTSVS